MCSPGPTVVHFRSHTLIRRTETPQREPRCLLGRRNELRPKLQKRRPQMGQTGPARRSILLPVLHAGKAGRRQKDKHGQARRIRILPVHSKFPGLEYCLKFIRVAPLNRSRSQCFRDVFPENTVYPPYFFPFR